MFVLSQSCVLELRLMEWTIDIVDVIERMAMMHCVGSLFLLAAATHT